MVTGDVATPVKYGRASTTSSRRDSPSDDMVPDPVAAPESSRAESQASAQPQPQPQARTGYQAPAQPPGFRSGGRWLLGVAALFGLIWIASLPDKNSPATLPSSPDSTSSSSAHANQPAWQAPAALVQAPSPPLEDTPPVARGNVLTLPQIAYCTAQSIRLDAAKEAVNKYSDSDVDRFNALVDDYNSRCGNFQYREGALESARIEVERFRSDYFTQGRLLFAPSPAQPNSTPQVKSASIQPKPPRPEPRVVPPDDVNAQISRQEQESIEAACSFDKFLNGPAAYSACQKRLSDQLRNGPRRPSLSELTSPERESIEAACSSDKYLNGPAAYNRCLTNQLRALGATNRRPSLDSLSSSERESIEAACSRDKYLNGPAPYNQCLLRKL